ncbi:MAG TPA: lipase maturation factor family protein [Acidothermaceae bacterium]|nr:lipase maturation factor family protein [Acidothermaceae bacterium]
MHWFDASSYWLARLITQRGVAALYLIAFVCGAMQFRALLGSTGLLPVPRFLAAVSFRRAPSVFHWRYSDSFAVGVCWVGAVVSALLVAGIPQLGPSWAPLVAFFFVWALYLSIVNVGQIFYAFGWESLLLEAGFLVAFLGSDSVAPPVTVIWLVRWLVFRVEFGAGLIKMRGDPCWRDLTCLYYHHETQPMPGPLSWYFHRLPRALHRVEVGGNHFAQLVVPFLLFCPQPVPSLGAAVIIVTQFWLVLSGNFSWLNWATIVLAFAAIDDASLSYVFSGYVHPAVAASPDWWVGLVLAVTALVVFLSYWPARNLLSRRQLMNAGFNSLHLVNAYGAFGSITRHRDEIVIEGAASLESAWLAYEFKGKPGDVRRRPRQFAPYHLRLDWLMWFAAMSSARAHRWFLPLVVHLLENDKRTMKLLRRNPFPDSPPVYIRAMLYRYEFTSLRERRATGAWWKRSLLTEYLPPVSLRDAPR